MKNKCFVMQKPLKMVGKECAMPSVGADEVLVKVEYCGICGSDAHLYQTGKQVELILDKPMVLGHEASGTVVQTGVRVRRLQVGDKVAIEPGNACGVCEYCKTGRYNLCPEMIFPSSPPYDGLLMRYVSVREDKAFKIPDSLSMKEATLMEPLACAFNATRNGSVGIGKTVAITGAGCIGLSVLLASLARGAREVFICDTIESRLLAATQMGAVLAVNVTKDDFVQKVLDATEGKGADVVIDCSGAQASIRSAIDLVGTGGRIVMMGIPKQDEVPFNFKRLIWKEATITSSFRYRNCYEELMKAVKGNSICLDGMITHEYPFDKTAEAFDFVITHAPEVIKAVIKVAD